MVTTKADLQANPPRSSGLITFANGPDNTIDADLVNNNFTYLLNKIINSYNWIIDQGPQIAVASSYSALQTYNVDNGVNPDIAVGKITSSFTNGNINVTPNGTGLFQYNGVEVANQSYVNQQIASAATVTGLVMTGATGVANGASGAVPQPLAGQQDRVLLGSGTWSDLAVSLAPSANKSGTGTKFATNTGAVVSGNFASWNAAGDVVDSGLSSLKIPRNIRKTSNQVTTTVSTTDTELFTTLTANRSYTYRFFILGQSSNAANGFRCDPLLTQTAGNTLSYSRSTYKVLEGGGSVLHCGDAMAYVTTTGATVSWLAGVDTSVTTPIAYFSEGIIVCGNSNVTLNIRFGPHVGSGVNTTLLAGSYIVLTEI